VSAAKALELMRGIRAAMSTREGRQLAREIMGELRRADDEATEADSSYVDQLLAKARKADRARAAKRGGRQ
jgi:hypothetical protein